MLNKKILLITIIFFQFSFSPTKAQLFNLQWDKSYGGDSRDWNSRISTNSDGEIFLVSDSQSDVSGNKNVSLCPSISSTHADIWLMKLDTSGAILWQRGYGADADERAPQIYHLNNNNKEMVMVCYSSSDIACDKTEPNRDTVPLLSPDYWICLLDSNGLIIWEKTLGGNNFDDFPSAVSTSTGEIIVSGVSNSPVGYDKSVPNYSISNDFWAVKLDANGNKIWDNVYGGDVAEFMASIIVESDGSFLLAGSTSSNISGDVSEAGQGSLDFWMIKVDSSGNKLWDKRFGGSGPDRCNYAVKTPDNGYILCGFTVSPQGGDVSEAPKGFQDYWVVKTDSVGNKQWDKRYGGNNGSFGTYVTPANSGYWIAGYSNSDIANDVTENCYGGSDYWILKTDSSGNKLFDKRFGGNGDEYNTSLALLSDSIMMVFGYSDSGNSVTKTAPNFGWFDNWLVKFSYTDTSTSINNFNSFAASYSVFPNPASDKINIKIHLNNSEQLRFNVRISDVTGRDVYNADNINLNSNQLFEINTGQYRKGLYVLTIDSDNGIFKSTIISLQ